MQRFTVGARTRREATANRCKNGRSVPPHQTRSALCGLEGKAVATEGLMKAFLQAVLVLCLVFTLGRCGSTNVAGRYWRDELPEDQPAGSSPSQIPWQVPSGLVSLGGGEKDRNTAAFVNEEGRARLTLSVVPEADHPYIRQPGLAEKMVINPVLDGRFLVIFNDQNRMLYEVTAAGLIHRSAIKGLSDRSVVAVYNNVLVVGTDDNQIRLLSLPSLKTAASFASPFEGPIRGLALHGPEQRHLYILHGGSRSSLGLVDLDNPGQGHVLVQDLSVSMSSRQERKVIMHPPPPGWGVVPLVHSGRVQAFYDPLFPKVFGGGNYPITSPAMFGVTSFGDSFIRWQGALVGFKRSRRGVPKISNAAGSLLLGGFYDNEENQWSGTLEIGHQMRVLCELVIEDTGLNHPGFTSRPTVLTLLENEVILVFHRKFYQVFPVSIASLSRVLSPAALVVISRPPDSPRAGKKVRKKLKVLSGSGGVHFEIMTAPKGFSLKRDGTVSFKNTAKRKTTEPVLLRIRNKGGGETFFGFEI